MSDKTKCTIYDVLYSQILELERNVNKLQTDLKSSQAEVCLTLIQYAYQF